MNDDAVIPLLPCLSTDSTIEFYTLLGFETTYQQRVPNPYVAMRRGGAHLHFFGLKTLDPENAFSGCLVIVDDVERLHELFAAALRGAYGKVPVSGVPRISRMRKGQTRFTVVDPWGNSLMFIRRDEPPGYGDQSESDQVLSPLGEALKTARRLRDFKGDDGMAAKVLDAALRKDAAGSPFERAKVLAARAELALVMNEKARATDLIGQLRACRCPTSSATVSQRISPSSDSSARTIKK